MTKTEMISKVLKLYINHTSCATDDDIEVIRDLIADLDLAEFVEKEAANDHG